MRNRTAIVVALFVSSFFVGSTVMAQQAHIVDASALRQAVASQTATDQQNRETLVSVLHRSDVTTVAGRLGLNVTRAENAVATLNSAELAQLAGQARSAEAALVGGSNTVIISTTTLLLIIIIVILVSR